MSRQKFNYWIRILKYKWESDIHGKWFNIWYSLMSQNKRKFYSKQFMEISTWVQGCLGLCDFQINQEYSELPRSDAATGDLTTQCVDITRCHVNFPKVSNLRKFRSQTDFSLYLNLTQPLLQDIFTCILLTFVPII